MGDGWNKDCSALLSAHSHYFGADTLSRLKIIGEKYFVIKTTSRKIIEKLTVPCVIIGKIIGKITAQNSVIINHNSV